MMNDVRMPGSVMFQHGIENGEQFAHASDQGHFLGLAGGAEPPITAPQRKGGQATYPEFYGADRVGEASCPDQPSL
ncbi:MAG: hypothetical protein EWM72_02834 [Nitrospira sp.]|nr:MAG: hypothetical protein EWM72_02834 [Nitrospira sp.]